jgi:hypothetical protein
MPEEVRSWQNEIGHFTSVRLRSYATQCTAAYLLCIKSRGCAKVKGRHYFDVASDTISLHGFKDVVTSRNCFANYVKPH